MQNRSTSVSSIIICISMINNSTCAGNATKAVLGIHSKLWLNQLNHNFTLHQSADTYLYQNLVSDCYIVIPVIVHNLYYIKGSST